MVFGKCKNDYINLQSSDSINAFYEKNTQDLDTLIKEILAEIAQYKSQLPILEKQFIEQQINEKKRRVAAKVAYSDMDDNQLRKAYNSIMRQISRIEMKIDSICENKEISSVYEYNSLGEIELVRVDPDNFDINQALYVMQQIINELREQIVEIKSRYTGTGLNQIPILDTTPDNSDLTDPDLAPFASEQGDLDLGIKGRLL